MDCEEDSVSFRFSDFHAEMSIVDFNRQYRVTAPPPPRWEETVGSHGIERKGNDGAEGECQWGWSGGAAGGWWGGLGGEGGHRAGLEGVRWSGKVLVRRERDGVRLGV